jgi:hypothetical protein
MSNTLNSFWLILLVIGMSGCATMSGDECMTSDWSAIGYEDGSRGYTDDRLAKHRKACAKHGVTPDFAAYQSGRDQGLVQYCQPSRGFSVGANGGRYNGVCRVDLEANFLDAYNAGYHLHTLRSNVSHANSDIHSKEHELKEIDEDVTELEAALISDDTTSEDRILILADLKEHSERAGQLDTEIKDLYDFRARAEVELQHYQVVIADLGY